MKKNTVKIIIATLLIAAVGAVGGMGISACINNSQQQVPSQITVATEKADKKNSDSDKTKETKVETQAPTEKATVKPTQAPTQKPTVKPTQAPTQKPTEKPAPTQAPTVAPTQAPTVAPTQAPTVAPTKPATPDEATKIYTVLKNTIKDSKAQGYKVVKLDGTDAKVLVLSFGKKEADRTYKFYRIDAKSVASLGKLSGCDTTTYIDKESGSFCLCTVKDGAYSLDTVKVEKDTVKLANTASGALEDGQKLPTLSGKTVSFLSITDFSGIDSFK